VLNVLNTAGTYSATVQTAAGTSGFKTSTPGAPTGFSTTAQTIANSAASSWINISQGAGGSIADGTYHFKLVYGNFSDFPANTAANFKRTNVGPDQVKTISAGGGTASVTLNSTASEFNGQVAVQFYGSSDGVNYWLQTCSGQSATWVVPYGSGGGNSGANPVCTLNSIVTSGTAAPNSNSTTMGYKLAWTEPGDVDVRYYAVYYADASAPTLSQGASAAQPQLIGTVPKGTTSFIDYMPNWYRIYNSSGGPYYGIVAVDREGNRSFGLCYNAGAGSSVSCN